MRIASFRMPFASSTLRPSQRSPISLLLPHFPLASRPNEQKQFTRQPPSERILQLEPEIVAVVPPRLPDRIPDLVVDSLQRTCQMGIEPVINAKLRVGARPGAAFSGGAG